MGRTEVVRTYVELRSADALRTVAEPDGCTVLPLPPEDVAGYRHLYRGVGRAYHWVDRVEWTDDQLRSYLSRRDVAVYELRFGGARAGFYELVRHPDGSTEIAYFGLLPGFHGRGLGGFLLTEAARRAWADAPARVWLHTCTLDHPAALPNYLARGFTPYREERYEVILDR